MCINYDLFYFKIRDNLVWRPLKKKIIYNNNNYN